MSYLAQGNYEFGISRIIKALEPYDKKLSPDTWFYAKRCFLALIENLAKHMVVLKDASFEEIMVSGHARVVGPAVAVRLLHVERHSLSANSLNWLV
jgi:hypothetical protein